MLLCVEGLDIVFTPEIHTKGKRVSVGWPARLRRHEVIKFGGKAWLRRC